MITPTTLTVHKTNADLVLGESNITLEIKDLGSGMYIAINMIGDEVGVDPADVDDLCEALQMLKKTIGDAENGETDRGEGGFGSSGR